MVDGAVAQHLEVLRGASRRGVGTRLVPGIGHAHAVHRPLLDTVERFRNRDGGRLQDGRNDINEVVELPTGAAHIVDMAGPRHGHALSRATEVRCHLFRPLERCVHRPSPGCREERKGIVGSPERIEEHLGVYRHGNAVEGGELVRRTVEHAFGAGTATEQIITIGKPKAIDCADYKCKQLSSQVRLVRIITPYGRIYVVMTSLLDSGVYPATDFAGLYHSRWRIEEAYKRLKYRMALENTSGLSWLAAQQDFGAKILADNLHSLTVLEAENYEAIKEGYKINRTYAFSHLKRCIPRWLFIALPITLQLVDTLAELIKNLIKCEPEASKPRPKHPKPHCKHAYKSTC